MTSRQAICQHYCAVYTPCWPALDGATPTEIPLVHQHDYDHGHRHDDEKQPARAPTSARAKRVIKAGNDDLLVCLEDGLTMKMLKRHLHTVHGLTPAQYRTIWGLPDDAPMVAANYAILRSKLAKDSGLGRRAGDWGRRGR